MESIGCGRSFLSYKWWRAVWLHKDSIALKQDSVLDQSLIDVKKYNKRLGLLFESHKTDVNYSSIFIRVIWGQAEMKMHFSYFSMIANLINPPVTMNIKMVCRAFLALAGGVSVPSADSLPEITGTPFCIQDVENILPRCKVRCKIIKDKLFTELQLAWFWAEL